MNLYSYDKPNMPDNGREIMIQQIRDAGESLIKNAKNIANSATYVSSIRFGFEVDPFNTGVPYIEVTTVFHPERNFNV